MSEGAVIAIRRALGTVGQVARCGRGKVSARRLMCKGGAAIAAAVLVVAPVTATLTAAPASAAPKGRSVFSFTDDRIDASSGLAVSKRWQGVVFTINDHAPTRVFAVDQDTGSTTATMRLSNADSVDWQAIAPDRNGTLWVGDIGDTTGSRSSITVYEFSPPDPLRTGFYQATPHELTYPDGAHDAQTVLINPDDGKLFIATKESGGGGLYEADPANGDDTLERVARVPADITDGAYSPDGKQFVLRTDSKAYLYSAPGKRVASFTLPKQRQGAGVAFSRGGKSLLLSGAGAGSDVLRLRLKSVLGKSTSPSPTPTASGSHTAVQVSSDDEGGNGLVNWLFVIGPFLIAAVAALVAVLWRRRTPAFAASGARGHRASTHARRHAADPWQDRDEGWPTPGRSARDDDWPVPGGDTYPRGYEDPQEPSDRRPHRRRAQRQEDDSLPFWLQS